MSKNILNMIAIPVSNQRDLLEQIISLVTSESNHLSLGAHIYVIPLLLSPHCPLSQKKVFTLSIYYLNGNELNEFHLTSELQSELGFIYSFKATRTILTLLSMSQIYRK